MAISSVLRSSSCRSTAIQPTKRWVIYAADGAYAIGSFDGKTFTPEHEGKHRFNWGDCFYASQTYSNVPPEDGRRIQIAWGQIGHPDMPFNQQMNFPVELTVRTTEDGPRLFAEPVKEIELLHAGSLTLQDETLNEGRNPLSDFGCRIDSFENRNRSRFSGRDPVPRARRGDHV